MCVLNLQRLLSFTQRFCLHCSCLTFEFFQFTVNSIKNLRFINQIKSNARLFVLFKTFKKKLLNSRTLIRCRTIARIWKIYCVLWVLRNSFTRFSIHFRIISRHKQFYQVCLLEGMYVFFFFQVYYPGKRKKRKKEKRNSLAKIPKETRCFETIDKPTAIINIEKAI